MTLCAGKVEGKRKKGRLRRTWGKQVEEESGMMVMCCGRKMVMC